MIKTRNASENELSSTVIVSCVFGLQILFFFIQVKNSVPVADPETDQNLIPETFKMENGGNIEIVPNFKLR